MQNQSKSKTFSVDQPIKFAVKSAPKPKPLASVVAQQDENQKQKLTEKTDFVTSITENGIERYVIS